MKRLLISVAIFTVITIAGSVVIGGSCFPAYAHRPLSLACALGMSAPLVAAVLAGLFFGWRSALKTAPLAILAPVAGLGLLAAGSHLKYWHGTDIVAALWLAAFYCAVPALFASMSIAAYRHYKKKPRPPVPV